MADSRHERSQRTKEPISTYPTLFVQSKDLPKSDKQIYGLEVYNAVEAATGKLDKAECVQKIRGLWRITLKCNLSRAAILTKGLSIRGHHVTVLSKNPFLSPEGEETVSLKINNVPYSVSHETIKNKLRSIGVVLTNEMQWEMYKDDNKMLACKTGRRFVSICPPKKPLPKSIKIADKFTAFLSYQGQVDPAATTSQTEDDRPGQSGATHRAMQQPMTPFRFGNDPQGRQKETWNVGKHFSKKSQVSDSDNNNNIQSHNRFDPLNNKTNEDHSSTHLKTTFTQDHTEVQARLELEPGEIPSEASNQKQPEVAVQAEDAWWDFVDTTFGTDPEEGRNYGTMNKEPPYDNDVTPSQIPEESNSTNGKVPSNKGDTSDTAAAPQAHPPKPQRKKAAEKKQMTLEDMASRGRSRTRSNQGKNGRASRGKRSQSPLFSEKEGRAGSKRRGGDTSTESTDSKRRKSVNTALKKTASRPIINSNTEEQNQVTAMETCKPDDDFRAALGYNS